MNKKQRNRKLVTQNKRNRMINRRYSSTIKTLSKLFKAKVNKYMEENNSETKPKLKIEALNVMKKFYSIVDKAVKKNVIHKNNAARKKSSVGKITSKL
jgi:small subunit ribosomal protein S20